jgi:hypothetical protein
MTATAAHPAAGEPTVEVRPSVAGLTDEAAAEVLRRHGPNVIPETRPPGVGSGVVAQLRGP